MGAGLASAIAIVACSFALADAQTPKRDGNVPGTGSISGTVVIAGTPPAPASRAVVELSSGELPLGRYSLTDLSGRFSFTGLPVGRFTVMVRKPGYVASAYGAKRPAGEGTPLVLGKGERVANLSITLTPGSVVTGSVIDQFGRPSSGMLVRAWRYGPLDSTGERLPLAPDGTRGSAITDDEGRYRLFGLAPGEYIVSAVSPKDDGESAARPMTDAEIKQALELLAASPSAAGSRVIERSAARRAPLAFGNTPMYNSSADAVGDATRIRIGAAEERSGIDVLLRVTLTGTVKGTVSGGARGNGIVRLVDKASLFERTARWNLSDGAFTFPGVPPGNYSLLATADSSSLRGRTDVFVAGQDVITAVYLQTGADVVGRVALEGSGNLNAPPLPRVSLTGVSRGEWPSRDSRPQPDGTFMFSALPSGAYRMDVSMQPGWRTKSAMLGGVDLLDAPLTIRPGETVSGLVITMTDVRSEISGVLQGSDGRALADDTIIVFAADRQFWTPLSRRTQATRPGTDGRFSVMDLPAGDYIIAAVSDVEPGQWKDPQFLADIAPYGVKISLADGEKKVQDIRIGGGSYSTR